MTKFHIACCHDIIKATTPTRTHNEGWATLNAYNTTYLCFIAFLYLDLYVLGDDALII